MFPLVVLLGAVATVVFAARAKARTTFSWPISMPQGSDMDRVYEEMTTTERNALERAAQQCLGPNARVLGVSINRSTFVATIHFTGIDTGLDTDAAQACLARKV